MPRALSRQRPLLDRSRVLDEAIAFADARGVDALSMRALAERLGVGAMTLYSYVANKDELLAGMVDAVVGRIDPPDPDVDPRDALARSSASAHRVLLDHPWAAMQWMRSLPGPLRTAYMEALLRALTDWGLDDDLVYRGYHAVTMHIVGFTTQELGYQNPPGGGTLADAASAFLDGLGNEMPHLAAHVRAHLGDQDHGDEFGFVLDLILDGLARTQSARG